MRVFVLHALREQDIISYYSASIKIVKNKKIAQDSKIFYLIMPMVMRDVY